MGTLWKWSHRCDWSLDELRLGCVHPARVYHWAARVDDLLISDGHE
jgi:hypothetical protein